MQGTYFQVACEGAWLNSLVNHPIRIVIAGNHDFLFEKNKARGMEALGCAPGNIAGSYYLQDDSVTWRGQDGKPVSFYGSPYTPRFYDWAFQLDAKNAVAQWAKIPEGTDILVTHGPPAGMLDRTYKGDLVGCPALWERVAKVQPRVHIFGHVHESHGAHIHEWPSGKRTAFINAAIGYHSEHPPFIYDLELE